MEKVEQSKYKCRLNERTFLNLQEVLSGLDFTEVDRISKLRAVVADHVNAINEMIQQQKEIASTADEYMRIQYKDLSEHSTRELLVAGFEAKIVERLEQLKRDRDTLKDKLLWQ